MKNAFDDFLDETGNIHFSDDDTLVDYVERKQSRGEGRPPWPTGSWTTAVSVMAGTTSS